MLTPTQYFCGALVFENSYYPSIKSDFEGLLSRNDLDETAQAIIAQLQDLIAKQGMHSNVITFSHPKFGAL